MNNCNHNNENCHECQKSGNMDVAYAIIIIVLVIGGFWIFGWSFFTEFWWFWVIVGVLALCGLAVYLDKKKRKKK